MKRVLLFFTFLLCGFILTSSEMWGLCTEWRWSKRHDSYRHYPGFGKRIISPNLDLYNRNRLWELSSVLCMLWGISPDDMEALLRSPDFKRWYSGKVEPKYEYYFKKNRPSPEFFNIRFAFRDSLHIKPQILPTSMVNPIQMNLVFVELFARATAACGGNFNKLFVPFSLYSIRCVQ